MAHFAYVVDGVVERVHVLANPVITDGNGQERESLGQQFLAELHGGNPADYIQTSYNGNPVNGVDRGPYAGVGYRWDGSIFLAPDSAE